METTFFKCMLLSTFMSVLPAHQKAPVMIEGKVLAASTGKPVYHAHVYVLDGEEEALTDNNGDFQIKTWQRLPLKLTAEKQGSYEKASILINDLSKKQVIRLKNR